MKSKKRKGRAAPRRGVRRAARAAAIPAPPLDYPEGFAGGPPAELELDEFSYERVRH